MTSLVGQFRVSLVRTLRNIKNREVKAKREAKERGSLSHRFYSRFFFSCFDQSIVKFDV